MFGANCSELCNCNETQFCDRQTGKCSCRPGYIGDFCKTGKYASFCCFDEKSSKFNLKKMKLSYFCSSDEETFVIFSQSRTKQRNNSKKQLFHWPSFIPVCPVGLYGIDCESNCSTECVGNMSYCAPQTGECTCWGSMGENCTEGW